MWREGSILLAEKLSFQEIILTLQDYWSKYGCLIAQPYDLEVGAGTGATSEVVIDRIISTGLSDRVENYLYTDISPYFFSEAKIRYKDDPWVFTQVFDLEKGIVFNPSNRLRILL